MKLFKILLLSVFVLISFISCKDGKFDLSREKRERGVNTVRDRTPEKFKQPQEDSNIIPEYDSVPNQYGSTDKSYEGRIPINKQTLKQELDSIKREYNNLILKLSNAEKEILKYASSESHYTLDFNEYVYTCKGCVRITLERIKKDENLQSLVTSNFYNDFFNVSKIPYEFAEILDKICISNSAYIGSVFNVNWKQVDSVVNNNKHIKSKLLIDTRKKKP